MATVDKTIITVEASINAPAEKVWRLWTDPKHIVKWNNASDDWHTPKAENDLKAGGKFLSRMEAKDGSQGFDFKGTYNKVEPFSLIEYTLEDNRKVRISFSQKEEGTIVKETFEPESSNSLELQQQGWQAILDNFKKYVEASNEMNKLHYEVSINADIAKVYQTMIDEKQYSEWTKEFSPSSHYKGSWDKGSKILFIGSDQDGNMGGMIGRIKENIPNKFISIEHYGLIDGNKEITSGPEVQGWAGALENYTFTQNNGSTVVSVDVDTNQEFTEYFAETWPKALNKLKSICEK